MGLEGRREGKGGSIEGVREQEIDRNRGRERRKRSRREGEREIMM